MERRRFDFFYIELCCALERRLPRYALWLAVSETSPTGVDRSALLHFFDRQLDGFLAGQGASLADRPRRQLRRKIARHRPEFATPCEVMARMCV